ncbi:MAG: hypothetical protein SVV03_00435 [Candidatus Nanohaloarchaea archaeon]|nr:hypothetical protein [Candidatus Nanohaloarchaea archaeon]
MELEEYQKIRQKPELNEELEERVEKLVDKYSEDPEKGRRALKLAAKLIDEDDKTIARYIDAHDTKAAGLGQSILYERGTPLQKFDKPHGGDFLTFKNDEVETAKFTGYLAAGHSKFQDRAARYAEFQNRAASDAEFQDIAARDAEFLGERSDRN